MQARSARISLTATVFAPIPIFVMIYLVETYTPDSLSVQDVHPVGRVFFCILAATLLSAFAVISAIRPIIEMRIAPLVGLTVLGFGWVAFVRWYDWEGLLEHGKAWVGLEYAENGDGIGAVRAVEVVKKWVQPFPDPYPVTRLTRSFESKLFPRCSPSGQFVIYVWYRPSTPEFPHSRIQLRAVDRNGKNDRLLLPDQEMAIPNQTSPSFSPDGRQLLFEGGPIESHTGPWKSHKDAYLCEIDNEGNATNVRRVLCCDSFLSPQHSSWSPEGERIAFSHNDDLCMADLNGERLTILAGDVDDSWMYYSPDISPDGKTVVFIRADDVGAELCTIRLDGRSLDRSGRRPIHTQTAVIAERPMAVVLS